MKIRTHFEGVHDESAHWEAMLEPLLGKHLLPLLAKHGVADGVLHATLGKRKRGAPVFTVKLHMHLPGKKIVAVNAEAKDAQAATALAVERLERETLKHFEHLRHQDQYKRRARRARLEALRQQIAALPEEVSAEAQRGIEALIGRLENVAQRELAYLRAVGDLPSDYPTVRDVVDEAVASTKAAWQPGKDPQAVYRQLLKNLFKVIDREVEASRQFGEAVSLEAHVPKDAEDQAEAMVQEEFYEFHQPDEVLSVADVIPAEAGEEAPLPEAAAEAEQAWVVDVIKDLPIAWRRALLLTELERLAPAEIAEVLEATENAVAAWLDQAIAFVHARVADAGLARPSLTPRETIARLLGTGGR